MEYIIIWILFGGICYFLAEKKNKNTGLAVIMGVIFGIFAVLYYAFCDSE